VPPPGPGSPSLAPRPGAASARRGSPPLDLAPAPARPWSARPTRRPCSRRGAACPCPGHVSLPLRARTRAARGSARRGRGDPARRPRPVHAARGLELGRRAFGARPKLGWRGRGDPAQPPDPAMAARPRRPDAQRSPARHAALGPSAASARTPSLGAPSPAPALARHGSAQRGPGPARLRLARSWCPCVARRVRAARSRRVSAALRARARVVRAVLWRDSPCPQRTRLTPLDVSVYPRVFHA
jgi:hypothetical protein